MGNIQSNTLSSQLQAASRENRLGDLKRIIADNPHQNLRETLKTCLRLAAKRGHTELVKELLLKQKVNPNKRDLYGWCSLEYACMFGHIDVVDLIVSASADHSFLLRWSKTHYNETPLHIACRYKQVKVVKYLLEKGAKYNALNSNRDTPLHIACTKGNIEVVALLLKKNPKKNIMNMQGKKPIALAEERHHENIVDLLIGKTLPESYTTDDTAHNDSEDDPQVDPDDSHDDSQVDIDGPPHQEPLSDMEPLLAEYAMHEKVDVKTIKCILSGPPRVGKTIFLRRLLSRMINIKSENMGTTESTGFEKPLVIPIYESPENIPTSLITGDWTESAPEHEISRILNVLRESFKHEPVEQEPCHDDNVYKSNDDQHKFELQQTMSPQYSFTSISSRKSSYPVEKNPVESLIADFIEDLDDEVVCKELENVTTVYLMDTGGQPEFHEILPIILQGPSLHLLFFNISRDLQESIDIDYRETEGETTLVSYKSNYNTQQLLHQLLSSLYCISKESAAIDDAGRPIAVLLGTYLDQLPPDKKEEILKQKNEELVRAFKHSEFYDRFLTFPTTATSENSTPQIFMAIDNMNGMEEELKYVKDFLKELIKDRFTEVKQLPYLWVLFHVILRRVYEKSPGVCTLAECTQLAVRCGIIEEHVPNVLDYIHRHLGTVLFYKDVPELNQIVICDPNVLFKSITYIIMVAFGGKKRHHDDAIEVRKKGEIWYELIQDAMRQTKDSPLKAEHLINLLKHYNIITEMSPHNYFMPCLLRPDSNLVASQQISDIEPLLLQFEGAYIPVGVFSALVVRLSQLEEWKLDIADRYRNHVCFFVGGATIHLISRMSYLETQVKLGVSASLLPMVYRDITESLKYVIQCSNHTKSSKFDTGFYCPGSSEAGERHFCECMESVGRYTMVCSLPQRCHGYDKPVELSHNYLLWYNSDGPSGYKIVLDPAIYDKPVNDNIRSWNGLRKIIDWKILARNLHIREYDIKRIDIECQGVYEQTVQVVITWKKQNSETEATFGVFLRALESSGVDQELIDDFKKLHMHFT